MIDEREIELIHGELDGQNSPEESVRVRVLLSTNPDARALYDDLRQLDGLMRPGAGEELPRTLHRRIMRALPSGLYRKERRFAAGIFRLTFRLPRVATVAALCAGVAIGIGAALFAAGGFPGSDRGSLMVGSSVVRPFTTAEIVADDARITLPGADIDVVLRHSNDAVSVQFTGSSAALLDLRLRVPGDNVEFESFHRFQGTTGGFRQEHRIVHIPFSGETSLGLLFRKHEGRSLPLALEIYDGERLVAERSLLTE